MFPTKTIKYDSSTTFTNDLNNLATVGYVNEKVDLATVSITDLG
jgi:hypothetical protein